MSAGNLGGGGGRLNIFFRGRNVHQVKNATCPREYCAKFVRGVVLRGPRKFVRNMRVGIKKCAEIVQSLCGTILAQKLGGASENMSAQILRIFPTRLELCTNTQLYRQIKSQGYSKVTISFQSVWIFRSNLGVFLEGGVSTPFLGLGLGRGFYCNFSPFFLFREQANRALVIVR